MRKICCFAGHSEIYINRDIIYEKLMYHIEKLIIEEGVSEFWVGHYGVFDAMSANAVRQLKERYPHIELNLIIPYLKTEEYKKMYDNILLAEIPQNTPVQYRIIKCNQYMVKKSAFLICYVTHSWGGAAKTLEFAKRQRYIKIINLEN